MHSTRAVCVHDLAQARLVLAAASGLGRQAVLISAAGMAGIAGCAWWRALIQAAGPCEDWLDCGDAAGHAMAALRIGQQRLILAPHTPALAAVTGAADSIGAVVATQRPPCLDLSDRNAPRALAGWLAGRVPVPWPPQLA